MTKTPPKPLFTCLWPVAGIVLLLMTACTVVKTTTVTVQNDTKGYDIKDCRSDLGAYRLPKTNLQVIIDAIYDEAGKIGDYVYEVQPVVRGSDQVFCLDYPSNPLASDTIKVKREVQSDGKIINQGLLQFVSSKAVDFSGIILRKLVRTYFIARSGTAGFQPMPGRAALELKEKQLIYRAVTIEFDPLSPTALAEANARFAQFGLCLTLGRFSYDTRRLSANDYCGAPVAGEAIHRTQEPTIVDEFKPFSAAFPGIAYRPKLSYDLHIYTKRDPTGPEPWILQELKPIALENKAPVFSIAIKRAVFAERRTVLIFDKGMLTGFCVSKSSEGAGFIEIPVEIIRSVVALPTQIFQVRIDEANDQAKLNKIHQETIELQNKLIRFQQGDTTALANSGPGEFKPFGSADGAPPASSGFGSPPPAPELSGDAAFLRELCKEPTAPPVGR